MASIAEKVNADSTLTERSEVGQPLVRYRGDDNSKSDFKVLGFEAVDFNSSCSV
jgi:hypothetical protein